MNKKLLVSVLLFFFVFSLGVIAQEKEKAPTIEYLFWYHSGRGEYYNHTVLDDPGILRFRSEPLLTFNVPPSPKSDTIFFEIGSLSDVVWWSGYSPQRFWSSLYFEIFSEDIPDFYATIGCNLEGDAAVTHPERSVRPGKNNYKLILRRDSVLREFPDWWIVRYVSTGERVSNEIANSVLNDFIDNGYDVEVSVGGETEGVKEFELLSFYIEVTRLSKY